MVPAVRTLRGLGQANAASAKQLGLESPTTSLQKPSLATKSLAEGANAMRGRAAGEWAGGKGFRATLCVGVITLLPRKREFCRMGRRKGPSNQ